MKQETGGRRKCDEISCKRWLLKLGETETWLKTYLNVTVTFKSLEDSERERDIQLMTSAWEKVKEECLWICKWNLVKGEIKM